MPSESLSFTFWVTLVVLTALFLTGLWAFVVWWKRKHYTRERFAFYGFAALLGFGIFYLGHLFTQPSIWSVLIKAAADYLEIAYTPSPSSNISTAIFTLVFVTLAWLYQRIFTHWDGQKSAAQYEEEQQQETALFYRDIGRFLRHDKNLVPHQAKKIESDRLEGPAPLAWHERARQLWLLQNSIYKFDEPYDTTHGCWFGLERNIKSLAVLTCPHKEPRQEDIEELWSYAQQVAKTRQLQSIELVVVLKNGTTSNNIKRTEGTIRYTNESELLEGVIDFKDYFAEIKQRVEKEKLPDSDFTIADMYTPSQYHKKDEAPQEQLLEDHILEWLDRNDRKQLAILGEYGQGKSTTSLMLSYRMIQSLKNHPNERIPILIELRGKTLRTTQPEEIFSIWVGKYGLNSKALMQLHLAGRLLLIFEGFDEIDLSGNTEARINHFRPLWKLNHENSKIIITGRPNFFLDSDELRRALGNEEHTHTLYLAPFFPKLITQSLRRMDSTTRTEILDLAEKDKKFAELISRPSLLYVVAILWKTKQLSLKSNINSAMVLDLFIRKALKRQQEKHDERPFMKLNSAERHYFMLGIATHMMANKQPNQIDKDSLNRVIRQLIETIPNGVSQSVGATTGEDARPLHSEERYQWKTQRDEIIEMIQTDVRSCAILVTDSSKDGTFKFAHKSYMEFLQAQAIYWTLSKEPLESTASRSLGKSGRLKIIDLQNSDEAFVFLAELLKEQLEADQQKEDRAILKDLMKIIVMGNSKIYEIWGRWGVALSNLLLNRFGIKNHQFVGRNLILFLFAFLGVGGFAGVFAVAGASAFAVAVAFADAFLVAFLVAFAVAVAGAGAGAGAVAGTVAGAGTGVSILVNNLGWSWFSASILIALIFLPAIGSGSLTGLASSILSEKNSPFSRRLQLWYRACQKLKYSKASIESVVGKGMVALLEQRSQEEQEHQEN